jgi:AraC-like DNA-binding protein
MQEKEWAFIRHNAQLDVELLHAYYVQHAYPRHSHDYYVVSVIRRGRQSFTHKGTKYTTPAGGLILINPGDVHTGEAVDRKGFELYSLYPTIAHMERAMYELTARNRTLPCFSDVRVDNSKLSAVIVSLHSTLAQEASTMEAESRFISVLTQLIQHHADTPLTEQKLGHEKESIQKARRYLDECFAERTSLTDLGRIVGLSPYYLLRTFSAEVGMPPYAYLESVRIRETQKLIETGKSLAEIAAEVGFSSQSHMTRSFKRIIGVTPGQYAHEIRD